MNSNPPTTRLTLLRHGETVWNREGRMQGHGDSPLSPDGEHQVEALARRMAGSSSSFTHLYSSDLGRAMSTAEAIARRTGLEVLPAPELRERAMGLFEGLTREEVRIRHPGAYAAWKTQDPTRPSPGGESIEASTARMLAFCQTLAERHRGGHVVAVSHGGVMAGFLRHILGIPEETARHFKIPNASVNVFLHDAQGWWLQSWGDTAHLEGLSETGRKSHMAVR
ncbi:MAG: histidine phosphatase family protein [Candidatus Methylacidiphilales bacterium]|nr:histidine phosphatase family protein [Candidatus Methylacidiphilales bacterium]